MPTPEYPHFMRLCWWLTEHRLAPVAAGLRWAAYMIGDGEHLLIKDYDDPANVGYRGWVEKPGLGVVAFVKLDGSLQFMW